MGAKVSSYLDGDLTAEQVNAPANIVDPVTRILSSPVPYEPEVVVPEGSSLYQTVEARVKEELGCSGDWVWLNCRLTGKELRASEAITYAKKFSVVLGRSCPFSAGDVIHLAVGNHNLVHSLAFGTWILGGVASIGDPDLEATTISKQLETVGAKVVVCNPETRAAVARAVGLTGRTIRIFCLDARGDPEDEEDLTAALDRADPEDSPEPHGASRAGGGVAGEPICIMWSSGTTGIPKGITHSHVGVLENFSYLCSSMSRRAQAVVLTNNFFHCGFMISLWALLKGVSVSHMAGRGFHIDVLVDAIIEKKPAMVSLGPHHYVSLSEHERPDVAEDPSLLDSLKLLMPVGGAVPPVCEARLKNKFRNLKAVVNEYGQTELGAVAAGVGVRHFGRIDPGVEFKVVHPDTDEPVRPNEEGEICVRTPRQRMLCYWGRPKETAETVMPDGFVRTGDVGKYNEKGEIHYVDRMRELLKYHNHHVSPTELEDILQEHPAVGEVMVFGRPDPHAMELVTAVVVRSKGFEDTVEKELVDFVAARVVEPKRLHGGVMFADSIPRNSVGKLLRREMRKWAQEKYDNMEKT